MKNIRLIAVLFGLCLVITSFSYLCFSTQNQDNISNNEVNWWNEFSYIEGTRANDTVNYTQIALDFVMESYPNKTYEVVSNSTIIPYRETGISYEYVVIDIIPGEDGLEDSVGVTVRHDTLNTEFGQEQYMRDYNEYWDALPNYYKKMWVEARVRILKYYGYYPKINDPILETYNETFTIYYEVINQTQLTSYMDNNHFDYSIENTTGTPYIITNLSHNDILLIANQSYVQYVGYDIKIQFIPLSNNNGGELYIPKLIGFIIIVLASIITILGFVYKRKRNNSNIEARKVDDSHVQTKERI